MAITQTWSAGKLAGWLFGSLLIALGVLNLILIHPVPGLIYMVLALLYLPPMRQYVLLRFRVKIPPWLMIVLGILVMWFTLGISELAERYGF